MISERERLDRLHAGLKPEPVYYMTDGIQEVKIEPHPDGGFEVCYKNPECDWYTLEEWWFDNQIDAEITLWNTLGDPPEASVSVRCLPGCFESPG